jgi:peptidoglycan/LPS O-acetylase OafA/YrhL
MTAAVRVSNRIHSIDHLRVYAALTVVFGHAVHFLNETRYYRQNAITLYRQGTGSVVFMAIAAFVAFYTERGNFGSPANGWTFLKKRMLRLAPLYWIFSTLWLLIAVFLPHLVDKNQIEFGHVASSYLFLPHLRPDDGRLRPILALGWVLNYIAWFTALLAVCLACKRAVGVTIAFATLIALFVTGAITEVHGAAAFFVDGFVLVFAMGMAGVPLHGLLEKRGVSIPFPVSVLAVAALFAMSWARGGVGFPGELWLFGCAWLILMVAALTRPLGGVSLFARTWDVLGKSSYSIYLSQPFSLGLFVLLLDGSGIRGSLPFLVALPAAIALALLAGVAVHYALEKPLGSMLRNAAELGVFRWACSKVPRWLRGSHPRSTRP